MMTAFMTLLVNAIIICGNHQIGAQRYDAGFEQCAQIVPAASAQINLYYSVQDSARRQHDLATVAVAAKALAAHP